MDPTSYVWFFWHQDLRRLHQSGELTLRLNGAMQRFMEEASKLEDVNATSLIALRPLVPVAMGHVRRTLLESGTDHRTLLEMSDAVTDLSYRWVDVWPVSMCLWNQPMHSLTSHGRASHTTHG